MKSRLSILDRVQGRRASGEEKPIPAVTPKRIKKNPATPKKVPRQKSLILDSVSIRNYRCFQHLSIEKLGRVNLFLGKNNAGKTALLEALYIFGENGKQDALMDIIYKREEVLEYPQLQNEGGAYQSWAFENLFRNRPSPTDSARAGKNSVKLSVSSLKDPGKMVSVGFMQRDAGSPYTTVMRSHSMRKFPVYLARLERLDDKQIYYLWRNIEMTPREDFIIKTLKLLAEDLISVRLLDDKETGLRKIPYARLGSRSRPTPLRSLGFGINRLFEIFLLGLNCRNGLLLIDEIESGIHHTALKGVWTALFRIAHRLNVQIFLTGSGDSSASFKEAAASESISKAIFHLHKVKDEVVLSDSIDQLLPKARSENAA